jgi:hypothetical protein
LFPLKSFAGAHACLPACRLIVITAGADAKKIEELDNRPEDLDKAASPVFREFVSIFSSA